jgi:XTP/dITP diphosphohydrolase
MPPPTLLFASQNRKKAEEIRGILGDAFQIRTLTDMGYEQDLDEPFDTFEANAKHKARQGFELFALPCFAEDAGLVVEALNGRPGVQSARYAGKSKDPEANMDRVLSEMGGIPNRRAFFIAFIAYFDGREFFLFEGRIHGLILPKKYGSGGFGYDPIFQPDGFDRSFAEMDSSIKNKISHRAIALRGFTSWLKERDS